MRFRHIYMVFGTLLVLVLSLLTDPDTGFIQALPFGASTIATLIILLKAIFYVAIYHISRKGLMDYYDMGEAWNKAKQTSEGAGSFNIGVGLYCIGIAIVIYAATH